MKRMDAVDRFRLEGTAERIVGDLPENLPGRLRARLLDAELPEAVKQARIVLLDH